MSFIKSKKERIRYAGFDDWKFMLIGMPLLALFIPLAFFQRELNSTFPMYYLDSLIHVFIYWMGCRSFLIYVRKKYEGFIYTKKRIILEIIFVILYGGIMPIVLNILFGNANGAENGNINLIHGFLVTYFSSVFILTIYEMVYLYHQNRENIIQREKIKQEQIKSELQVLRDQVNPHFLFNSLNTLTNIIHEDQNLATSFIKNMSDVYRYILEKKEQQLIPLKDELKFIESYIFLQKERFKNNLEVTIEVSDYFLEKCVVPLSLQILFENAIKHNVISSKYPLKIEVFIDAENYLLIQNKIRKKSQSMPSTGVGLKNIISRFSFFTNQKVEVIDDGINFKVRLPLIEQFYP